MAAASVLLGLTPTILANFAPAIAEIALLSSRRPFLSLLLSMGAPATYQLRFLEFENPINLLIRPERPSILRLAHKSSRYAIGISLLQYCFAILAIWNLISASLELGQKTILSWRCSVSFVPLLWAMTPIACHAPAVLSLEVYRRKVMSDQYTDAGEDFSLVRAAQNEFTISAINTNPMHMVTASKRVHPGAWSIVLQSTASIFSILQIIFGTAVLSSLLFIGVEDATILLLRYASSAFICKLIMFMELEGMVLVAQEDKGICGSDAIKEVDDV